MATSSNAIAIGRDAVCTASNSVAIGAGAMAFDPVAAWGEDRIISEWVSDLKEGDLFYIKNDPGRPCIFLGYGHSKVFEKDLIIALRKDGVIEFAKFRHVPGHEIVILSRVDEPAA